VDNLVMGSQMPGGRRANGKESYDREKDQLDKEREVGGETRTKNLPPNLGTRHGWRSSMQKKGGTVIQSQRKNETKRAAVPEMRQ